MNCFIHAYIPITQLLTLLFSYLILWFILSARRSSENIPLVFVCFLSSFVPDRFFTLDLRTHLFHSLLFPTYSITPHFSKPLGFLSLSTHVTCVFLFSLTVTILLVILSGSIVIRCPLKKASRLFFILNDILFSLIV